MSTRFWQETPTDHPVTDLPDRADVVVVGAGITGLTTALLLAEAGRSVAVVESRKVGAGASGATTGKVSQLQGTRLSTLVDSGDRELAEDYLAANTFGMDWLRQFCLDHRVPVEHASAFTFSTGEDVEQVGEEHRVARSLGLATRLHGKLDQPFPVAAAVELPGQFQLNPAELLQALSRAVVKAGGTITEDSRVTRVTPRETPSRVEVSTRGGDITAGQVILATATPILDRRSATFQLMAQRSYLCAFDVEAQQLPTGMFISVETPRISLRTAGSTLLVGGFGHRTGTKDSTRKRLRDIEEWTGTHFPGARLTHSWSAQDFHPAGLVPMVGSPQWGEGLVHYAGGYSKWGLAVAPAAAHLLVDHVMGRPRRLDFGSASRLATAKNMVKMHADTPAAQVGNLVRAGIPPRHDGLSLVCPHLGGTLAWNDAEESWDCPLHGSRFDADGTLLEGPAVDDLKRF